MVLLSVTERAQRVRVLVSDVDGILTDGRVWLNHQGEESLSFWVQDGLGIRSLQKKGILFAVISGRFHAALPSHFERLGVEHCYFSAHDKVSVLHAFLKKVHLTPDEVAYIGDDTNDVGVMKTVMLSATVLGAHERVFQYAQYVCRCPGGQGAVRELCDLLLDAHQRETGHEH